MSCLCLLAAGACNRDDIPGDVAEIRAPADQTPEARETASAGDFVRKAAAANSAEIQLGQLASQRAQNPDVKQFAQKMVTDHTLALDQLTDAAKGSGLEVSRELDAPHQAIYEKLSGLKGAAFDREYMTAMVNGHQQVESMLAARGGGTSADSTDVSSDRGATAAARLDQWAAKTLPEVRSHLAEARKISDRL